MREKKDKKKKDSQNDWMTTYSDMVTLLMVFVMLISFGDIKKVKTRVILSAFSGKLGFLNGGQSFDQSEDFETLGSSFESLTSDQQAADLNHEAKKTSVDIFKPEVKSKRIRIIENREGITISLFTDAFFSKDSAAVNLPEIRETLENIRLLLSGEKFSGEISIEGHTDSIPYEGNKFRDNWDLSMQRAWAILDALRSVSLLYPLDEDRISIHGYGPNRPIASNDVPQERLYNRRVDIVLKRTKEYK